MKQVYSLSLTHAQKSLHRNNVFNFAKITLGISKNHRESRNSLQIKCKQNGSLNVIFRGKKLDTVYDYDAILKFIWLC